MCIRDRLRNGYGQLGRDGRADPGRTESSQDEGNDLTTLDATIGQQERAYSISNNIFDPLFTYDCLLYTSGS